jgi:hypothetical protein
MNMNWKKLKYMLIGMFLTVVFLFSTAQDDGGYYSGNIEVERMASRIERFIKSQESFVSMQRTLISQQGTLNKVMMDAAANGRFAHIDSITYFDTRTGEIRRR